MKTLVLDAGHGAHDAGAVNTRTGLKEKDVVLDVVLRAERLLRGKLNIILTRKDDTFVSLGGRCAISNKQPVDYFLSIHCNSATNPAEGFEVFTSPGQTKADKPATDLINAYQAEFPGIKLRADRSDGDPDKEARFTVLTGTKAPAALLELEFIHTPEGSAFLSSTANRDRIAGVIAKWALSI